MLNEYDNKANVTPARRRVLGYCARVPSKNARRAIERAAKDQGLPPGRAIWDKGTWYWEYENAAAKPKRRRRPRPVSQPVHGESDDAG